MSFRNQRKTEGTGEGTRTCAQRASVHMRYGAAQTHATCTHATVRAARPLAAGMRQQPLGTHNLSLRVGGFWGASSPALGIPVVTLPSGLWGITAPSGRATVSSAASLTHMGRFVTGSVLSVPASHELFGCDEPSLGGAVFRARSGNDRDRRKRRARELLKLLDLSGLRFALGDPFWAPLLRSPFCLCHLGISARQKARGKVHGHAHNVHPFTCGTVRHKHMQLVRMPLYMRRGPSPRECGSSRSAPSTRLSE